VFVDKNFDGEQQPGEAGIPNAVIFLDDGNRITTDANGLFSVANVISGYRTGVLDLTSLPGYTLAPNLYFKERNSPSRLVHLQPGGLGRMNFAVTPTYKESDGSMKLRRKFLGAFLVAATVETLCIVMVAHPARTEPLNLGRENQLNTPEAIPSASPEPLPTPTMAPVTGEKAQTSPAVGGDEGDGGEKTSSPQLTPSSSLTQESKGAEEKFSPLQPDTLTSQLQSASTPLATGEVRILTPTPGTVLDVPAATVILQFTEGQ
jgi:hypothetical protein